MPYDLFLARFPREMQPREFLDALDAEPARYTDLPSLVDVLLRLNPAFERHTAPGGDFVALSCARDAIRIALYDHSVHLAMALDDEQEARWHRFFTYCRALRDRTGYRAYDPQFDDFYVD